MGTTAHEVSVQDLETTLDRLAVEGHLVDGNPVLAKVIEAMDGADEEGQFGDVLRQAIRKLLEVAVAEPRGFVVLALKTLRPDLTHDDLAKTVTALGAASMPHRARALEAVQRLAERAPRVAATLTFDNRGGDRHTRLTRAQLVAEYDRRLLAEASKPQAERIPVKGPGGVCELLAQECGIRGRKGKPSWQAVWTRVRRARKTAEAAGTCGNHVPKATDTDRRTQAGGLAAPSAGIREALCLPSAGAMTVAEVAHWLNVPPRTVRRLVAAGELASVRPSPGAVRVLPGALLEYVGRLSLPAPSQS